MVCGVQCVCGGVSVWCVVSSVCVEELVYGVWCPLRREGLGYVCGSRLEACLHYKTVRTRFRRSRFQNVFTRPHWNRLHVTRMCANSLIYHVSLPNNHVMYYVYS